MALSVLAIGFGTSVLACLLPEVIAGDTPEHTAWRRERHRRMFNCGLGLLLLGLLGLLAAHAFFAHWDARRYVGGIPLPPPHPQDGLVCPGDVEMTWPPVSSSCIRRRIVVFV